MNWHVKYRYDPERGVLINRRTGKEVGHKRYAKGGRKKGVYFRDEDENGHRKQFGVHRAIWEMHNGPLPIGLLVDHINRDPWDNHIGNLRLATKAENCQNTGLLRSACGFRGVYKRRNGRYAATISINTVNTHIGLFDTPEEAHAAYVAKSLEVHGAFSIYSPYTTKPIER